MQGRLEITVGGKLQQLADIDHQCPRQGRCGDPAIGRLDLKPGVMVLHHQRQVTGILVGADPLTVAARLLPRVVNELHVLVGDATNAVVKHPDRLFQHLGEGGEQGEGNIAQSLLPPQQMGFHLGQGGRPLVGADQPLPGFTDLRRRQGLRLIHDIELLSQIRPLAGQLGTDPVVAAKVGAVDHLHRQLLLLRQGKEALCQRQSLSLLGVTQAMPCQIEKADVAGGRGKPGQHRATHLGCPVEGCQIDDRQW